MNNYSYRCLFLDPCTTRDMLDVTKAIWALGAPKLWFPEFESKALRPEAEILSIIRRYYRHVRCRHNESGYHCVSCSHSDGVPDPR